MGDTCSACQANSNQQEIKSVALNDNKENAPATLPTEPEKVQASDCALKNSKQSNGTRRSSGKEGPSAPKTEKKMIEIKDCKQDVHSEEEMAIEEKKDERPKDMHSMVSQPHSPVKPVKEGVKLDKMPDYFNPLTKEKLEKLDKFQYSRTEYDVKDAVTEGPIEFDSKYVYEGEWKDGVKAGKGRQLWRDGSYYEGYWLNNMANGFGRLIHTDGDIYEGEWIQDRAEGHGVYSHICGAVFKGTWKNDKQEGYGEQVWPDNAVYKGQYCNGKKHGKGRFEWSDNSCYEGQFEDNNISGYGKYKWRDGRIYQGTWQANKMEGKGLFTWPDGRRYEGEYKNDKKQGFGTFYWPDGRIYKGEWLDGKQHGRGQYKSKRGSVREGVWQNGVRIRWLNDEGNKGTSNSSDI